MAMPESLVRTASSVYRYHEYTGLQILRRTQRFGRWFGRITAPVRRWMKYHWTRRIKWPVHRFLRRQRLLRQRIGQAVRLMWNRGKKNPFSVFPTFFHLCGGAIDHYWDELCDIARLTAPVAAGTVLMVSVIAWANAPYCLNVTYEDEKEGTILLGTISHASVYDSGATLAMDRVINADNSFKMDKVPIFSVSIFGNGVPMTETEMCDAILSTAGDAITNATGLYVDGKFVGAMEQADDLQTVLDSIQAKYADSEKENQRVEFVQKVEQVEGLYPTTAVVEGSDLKASLTTATVKEAYHTVESGDTLGEIAAQYDMSLSELLAMNPDVSENSFIQIGQKLLTTQPQTRLQVKVVETVTRTETIDYKTKIVYRDDKYSTWSRITTKGKEGKQTIVEEITYIGGIKQGKAKLIKKTVNQQPVTQVKEVGTKKETNSQGHVVQQGNGIYTGKWTWPVPVCHRVYQGYHRGHLAIDISSGPVPVLGTPCLAVDGGQVVYAGWYYGYGYYVKIYHGNGLYTTYAHLQTIWVKTGQQVSNGQQIGKVGNTGNSTGPHLHFEVIKNGVRVNPLNYITP